MTSSDIQTGAVRFGGGRRTASHWAKLAGNTDPGQLTNLLQNDWAASLPEPLALFSVVGGSMTKGPFPDFVPLPAHKALEFSRGFSRAAQSTGAWVLGGTDAHVSG